MKPNSLAIIQKIWEHRDREGLNMTVTLDAGANVHLLYPEKDKNKVESFISSELIRYCMNGQVIYDQTGTGPERL